MDDYKPFKQTLRKLKVKRPQPAIPVKQAAKTPKEPVRHTDEEIFDMAMRGVDPIKGKGREVTPPAPPASPPAPGEADRQAAEQLRRFASGELEFELEYTDEYMQGHVRGLDLKLVRQLKAGQLAVQAHLDLHGMTSQQAFENLAFFLRESYLQGRRTVLLVPGRGKGSPQGIGVLRRELQYWLTREPLKRIVLAFCSALPAQGGAGALYVLLRKSKKTEGKVAFDKANFLGEDW